jgi:hypothetical protein
MAAARPGTTSLVLDEFALILHLQDLCRDNVHRSR